MYGPWTSPLRDDRVDYPWTGGWAYAAMASGVAPGHRYPTLAHRPSTLRRSGVAATV